ncbi:MAG: MazG family protein [Nocardioidaceae bacterium]
MPARLTVLVTSPRLPAGLLSPPAWRRLHEASTVLASSADLGLVSALAADNLRVQLVPSVTAASLLELASDDDLVWLASDDGDEELIAALAAEVVTRSELGLDAPPVEILVGSFDPPGARLLDLVDVMAQLRLGCPWDRQQTHESLVRYLVEETYETIEAIETGDRDHLLEELGDLMLQVVFHARLATERLDDPFDIDDVAAGIVDKLVRRHPHVFADAPAVDVEAVETSWESIKAEEKTRGSVLDGIPPGLPALSLADEVMSRCHRAGMTRMPSVPVPEEPRGTAESVGETLFASVAAANAAGVDAEQALRARVRQEMDDVRAREQRALPGVGPDEH